MFIIIIVIIIRIFFLHNNLKFLNNFLVLLNADKSINQFLHISLGIDWPYIRMNRASLDIDLLIPIIFQKLNKFLVVYCVSPSNVEEPEFLIHIIFKVYLVIMLKDKWVCARNRSQVYYFIRFIVILWILNLYFKIFPFWYFLLPF